MAHSELRDRWVDGELLAAIAAGDGLRLMPSTRAICRLWWRTWRARPGSEAAADLAAEVFAAVLLSSRRYRDDGGSAAGWLVGIARNKLRVSRRRGRIESRARSVWGLSRLVLEDADLERVERLADAGRVVALVDSLPEHERDAVRRRVLEEQGYEQIAGELRCSALVIRKRVSRGLARLRERLEEQ